MSDDDGSDSERYAREEEERKQRLREKIDRMFGASSKRFAYFDIDDVNKERPFDTLEALTARGKPMGPRDVVQADYIDDPDVKITRDLMEKEKTDLGKANRDYYSDQLGRFYEKGTRNAKFSAARKGQLGGSTHIDTQAELDTDRNLGATRVDEAVRRAVTGLEGSRAHERLEAINLANAGYGDQAVSSAMEGLRSSFAAANNAQKEELFTDLFTAGAAGGARNAQDEYDRALAERYRSRLSPSFFSSGAGKTGRVTETA
jgi:hypothetical protein